MNEYERRLGEIRKRPRPTKLRPEQEVFLASLTIDVLKWINTQHRRFPDMDEAALVELSREAERLNDQDRQGLLTSYGWWQEYTPAWLKSAASE